jgi:hypothetical protein
VLCTDRSTIDNRATKANIEYVNWINWMPGKELLRIVEKTLKW